MSLNEELAAIEAVVSECEGMIESGEISVDAIVKRIQSVADPNEQIAAGGELVGLLVSQSKKINIVRLKELKHLHPNDAGLHQLGYRAAKCFLALNEVGLDVSEELVSPNLKQGVRDQIAKMKEGLQVLVTGLVHS